MSKPPVPHRGKSVRIRERLIEIAHQRGPSSRMPTVRELCAELETTPATLDGVLTELEARQILWRRQGSGIFVSPALLRRRAALLFNPSYLRVASPFWGMLVDSLQAGARQRDLDLFFHFSSASDASAPVYEGLASEIQGGRLQGVLTLGIETADILWIEDQGVPTVAYAGYGPFRVEHDVAGMIRLQVEALAEQGCRRIGLWMPVPPHILLSNPYPYPYRCAMDAFTEALADQGISLDTALIQANTERIPPDGGIVTASFQEQGFETASAVFDPRALTPPPDGIAILDDMMTLGALSALRGFGVRPGEHVRIATHSNIGSPILLGSEDQLTLIRTDPVAVADAMLDLLDERLTHKTAEARCIRVPFSIA